MKFRKYVALLVITALAAVTLAGCNQPVTSPFVSASPSPSPSPSVAASPTIGELLNNAGAYASIEPKTAMLNVDGKDVTWDELFFYINNAISALEADGVKITGWSTEYQGKTFKDYVLDDALKNILRNSALEYGAGQADVTLSPTDVTDIQANWDSQVSAAGGEAAFIEKLSASYCTKDIYMDLQELSALAVACFNEMYGDMGSKLSDQDAAEYTAEDGYLMAKHILMMTKKTDTSGAEVAMTDEEKTAVKAKMEDILDQLKAYKGDDFGAFFDQLMQQSSEDPGSTTFPNGYLFQSGDMVSQFEEGTKALEIGQFSQELVETEYGYHIIYRVPINFDVTPMMYSNYGEYTLRYISALDMFSANLDTWLNSLDVTYTDTYTAMDFEKMFAVG